MCTRPSSIYCGEECQTPIPEGAVWLQVNINVECTFVKDVLRGDDTYEMRLKYLAQNAEQYPYKEDD